MVTGTWLNNRMMKGYRMKPGVGFVHRGHRMENGVGFVLRGQGMQPTSFRIQLKWRMQPTWFIICIKIIDQKSNLFYVLILLFLEDITMKIYTINNSENKSFQDNLLCLLDYVFSDKLIVIASTLNLIWICFHRELQTLLQQLT